jgi:hypothetical protein
MTNIHLYDMAMKLWWYWFLFINFYYWHKFRFLMDFYVEFTETYRIDLLCHRLECMKGNSNKRIQHKKANDQEWEKKNDDYEKPVFSEYLSKFFSIL